MQAYVRSIFPDRRGPNASDAAPADTSTGATNGKYTLDLKW